MRPAHGPANSVVMNSMCTVMNNPAWIVKNPASASVPAMLRPATDPGSRDIVATRAMVQNPITAVSRQ